MNVRVEPSPKGTLRFGDVVLVVDVLRATTTATALLERGLHRLMLAESLASAQAMRQKGERIVGEDGDATPDAFDFSNSPLEILQHDFSGKTAILTTSNGTRAAHLAARSRKKILLACLNNAAAACDRALKLATTEVAILCAGRAGETSPDDTYTAGALAARLMGSGLTPVGRGVDQALRLYRVHPDPLPLFLDVGAGLERFGFGEDIGACARLDVSEQVAVLRGTRGAGLCFR